MKRLAASKRVEYELECLDREPSSDGWQPTTILVRAQIHGFLTKSPDTLEQPGDMHEQLTVEVHEAYLGLEHNTDGNKMVRVEVTEKEFDKVKELAHKEDLNWQEWESDYE